MFVFERRVKIDDVLGVFEIELKINAKFFQSAENLRKEKICDMNTENTFSNISAQADNIKKFGPLKFYPKLFQLSF